MVLLGMPTPESAELYAMTVTQGDPAWAGALAGVALGLPVYHVMEPELKHIIPADVYEREISFAEYILDVEALNAAVRKVRDGG